MTDESAERPEGELLRAAALASATAGMVITDPSLPDHPIIDANPAFERLTGYTRAEILGRNCRFLQGDDIDPAAVARIREAIRDGRDITETLLNRRKDGAPFWNELRIAPLRDDAGRITHFVGVQTDVSERVRAGAVQARLAAIVASSADAIIGKTLGGIITDWNPAAERLFGYPAAEALGRSITILVPDERASEEADILATIAAGGRIIEMETLRIARDGSPIEVALTVSPVRDGAGQIVGASTIARDIGERRREEAALREALRAAERATETLAVLEWVGRLLAAELDLDRLERGVAAAGAALTGASVGALVRPNGPDGVYARLARAGGHDAEVERVALPGLDPSSAMLATAGPLRVDDAGDDPRIDPARPHPALPPGQPACSLLAVPVIARGGGVLAELVFAHPDRAAFGERAETLATGLAAQAAVALDNARLYRDAQDAIAGRDTFLSIAAHELRTPLAALKGRVQLVRRWRSAGTLSDERLGEGLETIDEMASRLGGLVDDLLDVARLRLGGVPLRSRRLDPGDLARRVAERRRAHLDEHHRLEVAVAPGLHPIHGDPGRLAQVIDELIDNAAKHSPDGGAIRVTAAPADDGVLIRVEDDGIGLDAGSEETIFEPFGRSANATERMLPGLGLGLHLARGIVGQHGGRIWAESDGPDRGATVSIWLPDGTAR